MMMGENRVKGKTGPVLRFARNGRSVLEEELPIEGMGAGCLELFAISDGGLVGLDWNHGLAGNSRFFFLRSLMVWRVEPESIIPVGTWVLDEGLVTPDRTHAWTKRTYRFEGEEMILEGREQIDLNGGNGLDHE